MHTIALTTQPEQAPHDADHACDVDLAFEFLNTRELEQGALVDRLTSAEDALDWIVDHRLVHDASVATERSRLALDPARAARVLADVRAIRDALREVADAVTESRVPAEDAVRTVNAALRARPVDELKVVDGTVRLSHGHAEDPLAEALARLAGPIVQEIAEGRPDRLRVCANDTCQWVFFDSSRSGRRRWCDMTTCGNRAKAARHRARQKTASA